MGFPQPDTGSAAEDAGLVGGFLTTSGDINLGPFFNNDAGHWTAQTISGTYGSTLEIDKDGIWRYTADNSHASIQALNAGDSLTEVFTVTSVRGTSTITITIDGADEPPCFVSGTMIDTPYGPRPIETLQAGDQVLTRDNGVQTISWIGSREISLAPENDKLRPIRITKGALGPNLPDRDLLLSPKHRLLITDPVLSLVTGCDEVLCAAKNLINGQSIYAECATSVRYHHLLFETHQVLSSSGCCSESFYPGQIGLESFQDQAREEVFGLFPELRALPQSFGPTARPIAKRHEAALIREHYEPAQVFWKMMKRHAA